MSHAMNVRGKPIICEGGCAMRVCSISHDDPSVTSIKMASALKSDKNLLNLGVELDATTKVLTVRIAVCQSASDCFSA